MAEHGELEYATAEGNDLPAHEQGYSSFVHFVYVGLAFVVSIVIGLAVGGVNGHWFLELAVIIVATVAAAINLLGGGKVASGIALIFALICLAAA